MTTTTRALAIWGLLACALAPLPAAAATVTQASHYTSSPAVLGTGGYSLNFSVLWACDDAPQGTVGAPGQIDLVDSGGTLAARLTATIAGGAAHVSVQGAGSVSGTQVWIYQLGAGGTPANGFLTGTWLITGPAAGNYTLRFWYFQEGVPGSPRKHDHHAGCRMAGGSGPGAERRRHPRRRRQRRPRHRRQLPPRRPRRRPSSPRGHPVRAPAAATVFSTASIGATALARSGGAPLSSVTLEVSMDNGSTWSPIDSNAHASTPADSESVAYPFRQAGAALLRATATNSAGLSATAQQSVSVGKASQPAVSITPAASTVTQGQTVAFAASGGATGNYAWSGAASAGGSAASEVFPAAGAYTVSVVDSGNANYNPSAAAAATVAVEAAFYTLRSPLRRADPSRAPVRIPPNAMAAAVATPGPGNSFAGWTGDMTAGTRSLSVRMNSNKALTANFTALLPQTISYVPPGSVSARTPPFALSVAASSGLPVSLILDSGPRRSPTRGRHTHRVPRARWSSPRPSPAMPSICRRRRSRSPLPWAYPRRASSSRTTPPRQSGATGRRG